VAETEQKGTPNV